MDNDQNQSHGRVLVTCIDATSGKINYGIMEFRSAQMRDLEEAQNSVRGRSIHRITYQPLMAFSSA